MRQFHASLVVLAIAGVLGYATAISQPIATGVLEQDLLQQPWEVKRQDGNTNLTLVQLRGVDRRNSKGFVALVPSLGRGSRDFTKEFDASLAEDLAKRGFSVLLIEPRGIGGSKGSLDPDATTMAMLADDLEQVFDALEIEQVALVGHAFGNRLSRYFTAQNPDRVSALVLLAAGGDFELNERQQECLLGSLTLNAPDETRRDHVACAFFAQGNDPNVWMEGWFPQTAFAQVAAVRSVHPDEFKRAGGKPFLLVQPTEDFIAPPDLAGKALKDELGDQVTYVEIEGAGHALLPEKPDQLSKVVGDYLTERLR